MRTKQVFLLLLFIGLMGLQPATDIKAGHGGPIGICVTASGENVPCSHSEGGATDGGYQPPLYSGAEEPVGGAGCAGPVTENGQTSYRQKGSPHPNAQNVVASGDGSWLPAEGYAWVYPDRQSNLSVKLKPEYAEKLAYEKKLAEFEARKADVYGRLNEITRLRNQCRDGLAACSRSGLGFDQGEADRRRDIQYYIWGEASYYIPWSDTLVDVPVELVRDIGTWGGIKLFGYGGDWFWITIKRNIHNFGSTAAGGDGLARQGLLKAENDNLGFKPSWYY